MFAGICILSEDCIYIKKLYKSWQLNCLIKCLQLIKLFSCTRRCQLSRIKGTCLKGQTETCPHTCMYQKSPPSHTMIYLESPPVEHMARLKASQIAYCNSCMDCSIWIHNSKNVLLHFPSDWNPWPWENVGVLSFSGVVPYSRSWTTNFHWADLKVHCWNSEEAVMERQGDQMVMVEVWVCKELG